MDLENAKLVRSKFSGYRIVYPYKNIDGSINWFNFLTGGSWSNLLKVCFIVGLILGSVAAYKHDIGSCQEIMEDPCKYCDKTVVTWAGDPHPEDRELNFTDIKIHSSEGDD